MLKRIISLLISLIMVISLCACNSTKSNEATKGTRSSSLKIGDVITINEIGELILKKIQMSENLYANMTNGSYIATDTKGISYIDLVFRFKNKGNDIAASDIGHIVATGTSTGKAYDYWVNAVEDKTNRNIMANTTVHSGETATVHMTVTVPCESIDSEYKITVNLPGKKYALTYKTGDYIMEGKELTVGKTIDNSNVKAKINTMEYSLSMYDGAPEIANAPDGKMYICSTMEITNKKDEAVDVDEIISVSTVKECNTYTAEYFIKTGKVFAPEGKIEKNDTAQVLAVIFLPISYSKEDTKVNIAIDHEDFYFQLKGTEKIARQAIEIEKAQKEEEEKEAAQERARKAAEELRKQDDERKNLSDTQATPQNNANTAEKKDDSDEESKTSSKNNNTEKKSNSTSNSEKTNDGEEKNNNSKSNNED